MNGEPLVLAIPSKGRLKEQVEAWLADCGLALRVAGGARGYMAALEGLEEAQVRLASAADIAAALAAGEVHLGLTGEETFSVEGLAEAIARRKVVVRAKRADGSVRELTATIRVDTPQEREYFRHGGILQYVLRQLIER